MRAWCVINTKYYVRLGRRVAQSAQRVVGLGHGARHWGEAFARMTHLAVRPKVGPTQRGPIDSEPKCGWRAAGTRIEPSG